ncbi:hypothetical protein Plhal304r1_c012g0045121 [Plasmopara halstedii]
MDDYQTTKDERVSVFMYFATKLIKADECSYTRTPNLQLWHSSKVPCDSRMKARTKFSCKVLRR